MDTPGQINSHAFSSMPSQSDHELEDEVCKDETHNDVPNHMHEMTAMENDSHGSHVLSTVLTENPVRIFKIFSGLFPEFSSVISCVSNDFYQSCAYLTTFCNKLIVSIGHVNQMMINTSIGSPRS